MKKMILVAAAVLAVVGGGVAVAQGDAIAQRQAGFKRMGEHMTAMKAVADARGSGAQFAGTIDEMINYFQSVPSRFPAGTETGGNTKALPTIWSDRAGFSVAANEAVTRLQALRTAATTGDGAAFQTAWQAVGPACGACHRAFRAR